MPLLALRTLVHVEDGYTAHGEWVLEPGLRGSHASGLLEWAGAAPGECAVDVRDVGLRAGQTLGKYALRHELGRGSMGTVYLALDASLHREVALKVLNPALSLDPDLKKRFSTEARSIAALSHPHIIGIHAFDLIDNHFIIDMELAEGGSLWSIMAGRGMTVSETVHIAAQVLHALSACHAAGIIHRDIKPTNILLDAYGKAKLSDFGLVKILGDHMDLVTGSTAASSMFLGTPQYAPPEAWDAADPGPQWDLYSLGVVLYQAAAGETPYKAVTPLALVKEMAHHGAAPVESVASGVSPEFAALVNDLMAFSLRDRIATADEALARLQQVPEFEEVPDGAAPTVVAQRIPKRPKPPGRTRWVRAAWGGAMAVAALLMLAYLGSVLRDAEPAAGPAPAEPPDAPAPAQWELAQTTLFDARTLAGLVKAPNTLPGVFDVVLLDGGHEHPAGALLFTPGGGGTRAVLAFDSTLAALAIPDGSEIGAVTGDWAQYAGSQFRMGHITGALRWLLPGHSCTGRLEFTNEADNSVWAETVTLTRSEPPWTDTAFLLQLEALPEVQPLLFHELIPRGLPWAEAVAAGLPALIDARAVVPSIPLEPSWVTADGRLDEPFWSEAYAVGGKPAGVLRGRPLQGGARMYMRRMGNALVVGVALLQVAEPPDRVVLCLAPAMLPPVQQTPRWEFVYDGEFGPRTVVRHPDAPQPADPPWAFGALDDGPNWTAEWVVPLESMADSRTLHTGFLMRMNAGVFKEDASGSPVPIAQWGHPDVGAIWHGAVLRIMPGAAS